MNQKYSNQWDQLKTKAKDKSLKDLKLLFKGDDNRFEKFSHEIGDIFVDFSKNWITSDILDELIELSNQAGLQDKIQSLFSCSCAMLISCVTR